jgi:hypothetical protein
LDTSTYATRTLCSARADSADQFGQLLSEKAQRGEKTNRRRGFCWSKPIVAQSPARSRLPSDQGPAATIGKPA